MIGILKLAGEFSLELNFGKRLKQLREEKGMTQEKLGELLNLKKANISKYEHGKLEPSIESIKLMARIFRVSTDYLLGNGEFKDIHKGVITTSSGKKVDLFKILDADGPNDIEVEGEILTEEDKEELRNILRYRYKIRKALRDAEIDEHNTN